MKNKLISALILSVFLTAGCQDKELQAQIDELNRTVSQLTDQNKRLEMDLSVQKMRADNLIPSIFAEEEVVFQKSETINYPKSKEYAPEEGKIEYSVSTLKTNADWLNALLWAELMRENGNVPTREEFVAAYQKQLDDTKKEMLEIPSIGYEDKRWVDFIGQREKLATFAIGYYGFSGGAHGMGGKRYFTLDMTTHQILQLTDLFDANVLSKIKALLWEVYTRNGEVKDDETFVGKQDFNVSDNFYLDFNGVHFIYGAYEIAPYAAGEQDLTLGWWQLEDLLKASFKQQNYVKLVSEASK